MKNGHLIHLDDKIGINDEGDVLSIKSTRPTDVGNYTCIAKNAFGSDSFSTQLNIQGRSS